MNGADHLFAIILLASGVLGYVRGFIREAIALLSWLVGLWVAWHYAYLVNPLLGGALAEPGVREWAGRAIVLFLVLLAGAVVGGVTGYFLRRAAGLAQTDRLLGALFGLMRGAVVIGLLVIGGRAVDLDLEPWWDKTKSMPAADAIANWLEDYAQPAAAELYEQAAERAGS
jgi:membrane protein required for colicin V production